MNEFSPVAIANRQQARAAAPDTSVWVSASAGTGKTKVLTDRVLALMLTGTAPQRILCLTFTKAAAAEMANRISETLSDWVTETDPALAEDIAPLLGRVPEDRDLVRARQLFARVLETPGGMKIQTIHAFCQSVLRRFPLEAGLAPHFDLLTEQDAADLLDEAQETVIAHAHHGDDEDLAAALSDIVNRVHETNLPELLSALTAARGKITRLLATYRGVSGAVAALRDHLDLTTDETTESVIAAACNDSAFDIAGLKAAAGALAAGTKTDKDRSAVIGGWLAMSASDRSDALHDYALAFLTAAGTVRAKLATKKIEEANPDAVTALFSEADRLLEVFDRLRRVEIATATAALLTLGNAFLTEYARRKASFARLDFEDLIQRTQALLDQPGVAAWVLFKLDGGLDHVLIDEAQDTSPDQWAVIEKLTEEFFAGEGRYEDRAEAPRTVFAVGDGKQSIYSFQGAAPEGFAAMQAFFQARVENAEHRWDDVGLDVSFRSIEAVLRAVDAVFAADPAREGVVHGDDTLTHLVKRQGQAGLVELWPPVDPEETDSPPPWKPPVERVRGESAQTRLARLIAKKIDHMCEHDALPSKDRRVHPGDVLVLVRRRTGFVDDLVRALKDLEIPVAGVDRMVLIEQMAVMDLVALGRFLLLPEDDLTLATVLKSPLIGITEDELFELAHDRGDQTVWDALRSHAGADNVFGAAHATLDAILDETDFRAPFALYAHVLTHHDGRKKLLSRLGMDADDPIDEFLAQALEYERHHTPSLEGFLHWLEHGRLEVKRDLDQATRDSVRIMTVHGAKGLQAPIVFLPDTLQAPSMGETLLWRDNSDENPIMLWVPPNTGRDTITDAIKTGSDAARDREYRRLLYVAMTRAEDRLYVCGWNTLRKAPGACWYNLIENALTPIAAKVSDSLVAEVSGDADILRLETPQTAAPEKIDTPENEIPYIEDMPTWATEAAPKEPSPPKPLTPSQPDQEDPPVNSPLGAGQETRFRRGLLIHRLLQSLPDLPAAQRAKTADAFLARPVWELTDKEVGSLRDEVLAVLDHSDFAPLFGPGSKAEVPITGLLDKRPVSGQVDRLVVGDEEVMIIDYKTNRPPPRDAAGVSPAYVFQMASYRAVLQEVYPDKRVRCVLLWTDGPFITELKDDQLDDIWRTLSYD